MTDFSLSSNPNGVWVYGDFGDGFLQNTKTVSGVDFWTNGNNIPFQTDIGANKTGATVTYGSVTLPTNTMVIDSEENEAYVAFNPTISGTYTLVGAFSGVDHAENSHNVQIDFSSDQQFNYTIDA